MLRLPLFRGSRSQRGRLKDKKKEKENEAKVAMRTYGGFCRTIISPSSLHVLSDHASRVRYRTDNCRSRRRGSRGSLESGDSPERIPVSFFTRKSSGKLPLSPASSRSLARRAVRSLSSLLLLLRSSVFLRPTFSVRRWMSEGMKGEGWVFPNDALRSALGSVFTTPGRRTLRSKHFCGE